MAQQITKRVVDVLLAASALAVFAVPMLAIAAAIRIGMGPPVLFSQVRPGRARRLFCLYKFRTMTGGRDADGNLLPDADRLTALGRFLRRTSLDELPQLFNVLGGEMSLIGPRPLLVRYLPHYTVRESLRFTFPPGITGWAQVHGRNLPGWDERLEMDAWYVENWSIRLDLRILLMTVAAVLGRKGVRVDTKSAGGLDLDEERRLSLREAHRARSA